MSAGNGAPAPSVSCTGCRALQSHSPEQCCRSRSASLPHQHCNDTTHKHHRELRQIATDKGTLNEQKSESSCSAKER